MKSQKKKAKKNKVSKKPSKKNIAKKKSKTSKKIKGSSSQKKPVILRTGINGFTFQTKWEELRRKGVDILNEYVSLVKEKKRSGVRIKQLDILDEIEKKVCQ